ncbi:MAG: hypothetical protein IT374_24595 [Polyangiaceae bacterium]|nr:hypothetical protein [Polyangiaceae bacterium]
MNSRIFLLAASVSVVAVSACVDPEGRFDDYVSDTTARRGGGVAGAGGGAPSGCSTPDGAVPDPTGDFLVSCVTNITGRNPKQPLRFAGKLAYTPDGGGAGLLSMTLTPILVSAGAPQTLADTVGASIVLPDAPVSTTCGFEAGVGKVTVAGAANSISGSEIVLEPARLMGSILSADRLCAELDGALTVPFEFDMNSPGDSCVFLRCEGGACPPLPELDLPDYACGGGAGGAAGAGGSGGGGAAGEGGAGGAGAGGAGAGGAGGGGAGGAGAGAGGAGAGGMCEAGGGAGAPSIPAGPWGCAGVEVPLGPTTPTIDVTLDVVNGLTDAPVAGAVVKACSKADLECASPQAGPLTSGADGKLTFTGLPTGCTGWDGYFEVVAPTYAHTLRMFPFPITKGGAFKASLASEAIFQALGKSIAGGLDPARGHLTASAIDCTGSPLAPGVTATVSTADGASKIAYGGSTPSAANTATTTSGNVSRVFGFNLPEGPAIVSGALESGGTHIHDWPIVVRKGHVTSIALEPLPAP